VKWDEAFNSNLSLANVDSLHSFNDIPPLMPNDQGEYEVAVPGRSKVI